MYCVVRSHERTGPEPAFESNSISSLALAVPPSLWHPDGISGSLSDSNIASVFIQLANAHENHDDATGRCNKDKRRTRAADPSQSAR